ncbi:uncharacterized protein TNCV_691121 [Trichonephila clavipes]|nr:uncharacterized protein TNCV_691121 [Trichonephila clavipes]
MGSRLLSGGIIDWNMTTTTESKSHHQMKTEIASHCLRDTRTHLFCGGRSDLEKSGATAHEGQGLLCPSQYTRPLGAEVHAQMSRSGGQSEATPLVLKSPSKLGIHLSTHCRRDERLS